MEAGIFYLAFSLSRKLEPSLNTYFDWSAKFLEYLSFRLIFDSGLESFEVSVFIWLNDLKILVFVMFKLFLVVWLLLTLFLIIGPLDGMMPENRLVIRLDVSLEDLDEPPRYDSKLLTFMGFLSSIDSFVLHFPSVV